LISGNAALNEPVAGDKNPPNVDRSTKNGCCVRNESVDTASVDGDSRIVLSRFEGLEEIAWNVVAASPNKLANVPDTGATAPVNPFNESKNRVNPVAGADKYAATGCKCASNDGNA
jgi:hypothetical protein